MKITFDSPWVSCYLEILQGIISRMASNSSSCKTWCITLVSAIIVVIAGQENHNYIWISIMPIFLFFLLDSYYLALERQFRSVYNDFIKKLHINEAIIDDVFYVLPKYGFKITSLMIFKSSISISIWPFYSLMALMVLLVRVWVI